MEFFTEDEKLEDVYMLKGNYLFDRRDFNEAFECYNKVLNISLSAGKEDNLAFVYNKLAKCKICLAEYYEALSYLNKGYSYILLYEDKTVEKYLLYNLALCHRRLEDYDQSLEYSSKLISMYDVQSEFQDYMGAIILTYNCYIDKGYVEEGVQLYHEAIKKFSDKEDPLLGYIYNNLGSVYLDFNNFEKALEYLEKAREIREKADKANLFHTLINIAKVYEAQNLLEKAKELIYMAVEQASINKDKRYSYKAYEMLEKIYSEEKDYGNLEKVYKAMLENLEDSREDIRLLKLNMKLSLTYMNMSKYEEAKEFLEASLRTFSIN